MAFYDNFVDSIIGSANKQLPMGEISFALFSSAINDDPTTGLLDQTDINTIDDDLIIAPFQGLWSFRFQSQVTIPTEPLEDGLFSNDSVLGSPNIINLIAIVAPTYSANIDTYQNITTIQDRLDYLQDVSDALEDAEMSRDTLVLIQSTPIFKQYDNIHIINYNFEFSPDNLNLVAFLTLQQVRITATEYNYMPVQNVKKPSYSSIGGGGNVSPIQPSSATQKAAGL